MTFFETFLDNVSMTQELEFFARILVAAFCGALIGVERVRRFKDAGVRTHIMVALASALLMIVSKYGFADLAAADGGFFAGTSGADASRIASQVVTGISFLGAGVIFKLGSSVKGLTTAAGIWATSGIGLAIGAGMYFEGVFVTVLIILFQFVMHRITVGKDAVDSCTVIATVKDPELFRNTLEEALQQKRTRVTYQGLIKNADNTCTLTVNVVISRKMSISDIVVAAETDDNIVSFETVATA